MKRILTALWLVLAVPALALAQTYPDPETITVNDFAGLLPPEAEAEIGADLDALRADTGIEFTVVTLSRKEPFAPDQDLETFAAGLFDQWGIGDADRNDGILLLVLHGDREVRLELGKGYNNEWNRQARDVIDRAVLPAFREDRYEAGIRAGVTRTIETIARPFHAGAAPPESSGGISGWWASLLFAPFVLMMFWRSLKDRITAMGRCPQCGQRMLSVTRETIMAATRNSAGRGRRVIRCRNCDYAQENEYSISRLGSSKSSSSGFSGGSSGGGGASGRW